MTISVVKRGERFKNLHINNLCQQTFYNVRTFQKFAYSPLMTKTPWGRRILLIFVSYAHNVSICYAE